MINFVYFILGSSYDRILVILALLTAFKPLSAFAWCESYPTVSEEFQSSTLVFIGKVVAEEKVHSVGEDFFDGINYRIEVAEILRGRTPKTITVFSKDSSGRFPMSIGTSYLVFALLEQGLLAGYPVYVISNCGNSGPLSELAAKINAVRRLVSPQIERGL